MIRKEFFLRKKPRLESSSLLPVFPGQWSSEGQWEQMGGRCECLKPMLLTAKWLRVKSLIRIQIKSKIQLLNHTEHIRNASNNLCLWGLTVYQTDMSTSRTSCKIKSCLAWNRSVSSPRTHKSKQLHYFTVCTQAACMHKSGFFTHLWLIGCPFDSCRYEFPTCKPRSHKYLLSFTHSALETPPCKSPIWFTTNQEGLVRGWVLKISRPKCRITE